MIYIVSGWSNPGGSTTSFINLTNALNEHDVPTTFCGPHDYHLDKCKSSKPQNVHLKPDDYLITHFTKNFAVRPPVKKLVLSSHEQNIFPLKKIKYRIFDKIHVVSQHQWDYHGIDYPHFIIPNIVDELLPSPKINRKIGGVIGSIDRNKQTHISIQRAFDDGCEEVIVYGKITDEGYLNKYVVPVINKYGDKVKYVEFEENKQKIYDSVSDVYQSSLMETWGYVFAECKKTGTKFHGCDAIKENDILLWDKEQIVNKWLEELEYE